MTKAKETAPVLPEAEALAQIDAALAVLTAGTASYDALQAARETAVGTLALAEAEAARQSERLAEETAVRALALPEATITALLAAIEARYAPVPEPAAEVAAPSGKRPLSDNTVARNAAAIAAFDDNVKARCAAADALFAKVWAADLHGVNRVAGTRYCSIVALASGVANAADYRSFVAQLRHYYLSVGLKDGGASAATDPWVLAIGPHAPDGPKGDDSLPRKFLSGSMLALVDGVFRLCKLSTAGARFVRSDAAALALWRGASQAPTAPAAPSTAPTPPKPPTVPVAPASVPIDGAPSPLPEAGLTRTARCQFCGSRNVSLASECAQCGESEWNAS